ncbi:hypothetical protein ASG40_00860 [Methylobacterium sp. Leaf399]|uniref:SWIM zinc finger family protein n=1 Tax=Methylobacterium sp. Leaf399 TaxID=1736364 RepID=UPI0006F60CA3|nr:SWIM zinc finger family protein [Methylobacterium sp. Leaf399]KQT19435.1 hypothetical protein ASG40_00860 [Methylobacterium sp. Leaf399]
MSLTPAQILDLAPDAPSRKAGQEQAKPGRWSGLARAGDVVWGEIKGSGASPYRTVADLSGPASKCTCPSRKFPCKHGLGLMLVFAAGPEAFPEAAPPDWVGAWTTGRAARAAAPAADTPARPVDEAAQARRRRAREDKVASGLAELDLWLRDLMRRGTASLRGEPYAFFDRMAGRLVDAQAPGLARRVRALPGLLAAAPREGAASGNEAVALAVGRLGLILRAAHRLDALDPGRQAAVRAAIGFPVSAEEIARRPDETDTWTVLAHEIEEEDKLVARSVWLAGRTGGRLAQVLDYGTPGSPLPPAPVPGQAFSGALAFHPAAPELRAVLREGRSVAVQPASLPEAGSITDALDTWAGALAVTPWIDLWPMRLSGVSFGLLSASEPGVPRFGVGDAGGCLALRDDPRIRSFVAVAAGRPIDLFGLYDGYGLRPLGLVAQGRLYVAPPQDARPLLRRAA